MFAGKKSAQIREILISESAWEEMTCLFAPSLGFGLSMAFEFDYYLVDEVTAVGDAKFKEKCAELFDEKRKKSNLLMVSHSLYSLNQYCDYAVLFDRHNNVTLFDDVKEAIYQYKRNESLISA
ncbi:ABC transporter ATP-binding protein [Escherichia coli]|nr:hypothetical protein [Escherichia coli]QOD16871.1 ABC transporter ATP-binding protein [Escherichia coli O15:H12]HCB1854574.1 ABC transporter ATP-binding protein [Citrobacter freundii]EHU6046913.1 ABC transporter ATP-binding protein [Escherichia coli]EJN7590796.1 ABC transporter ATP-binding protein [Escherichia coli]